MTRICRERVLELMRDGQKRTAYDIHKLIGFSYATTHRYVKELLVNDLEMVDRDTTNNKLRIYYRIKGEKK